MFTWNVENNTESVGYEMKKKKAIIPKTTGWCPLLWHFLPGNNIRSESERNNNNNNNNNNKQEILEILRPGNAELMFSGG